LRGVEFRCYKTPEYRKSSTENPFSMMPQRA
jgi:hypothetical protein